MLTKSPPIYLQPRRRTSAFRPVKIASNSKQDDYFDSVCVTDLQNSRENAASRPVVGSWIASPGPYCGVKEQSHYGLRRPEWSACKTPRSRFICSQSLSRIMQVPREQWQTGTVQMRIRLGGNEDWARGVPRVYAVIDHTRSGCEAADPKAGVGGGGRRVGPGNCRFDECG